MLKIAINNNLNGFFKRIEVNPPPSCILKNGVSTNQKQLHSGEMVTD
jgi:hypothetical protein